MGYQVAVDIGGTFTDLAVQHNGATTAVKVPTTPDDLTDGFMNALTAAADEHDQSLAAFLDDTERLIHGTTVATNAILENTTAPTALITTAGFADTLLFREGGKRDPFNWDLDYPAPYVPRHHTYEVSERIGSDGAVVDPLEPDEIDRVVSEIASVDVEAVGVCLLWAHENPTHEQQLGDRLRETIDAPVSLSHRVNPMIREYRRMSSTVIDASLHSVINTYLSRLQTRLTDAGYDGEALIIAANGGVQPIQEITDRPIWTVDSGPTMLPGAAQTHAAAALESSDVIAVDMGGTSLDIGVVQDGDIPRTREATVGDDYHLGIEKVAVHSIGSGGGSIAWVDAGGLLRVGPESAGAQPGPACYGRGGDRPTVTDAALVLGYLNPEYFLGGDMPLDPEAARDALARAVADPLEVGVREAAWAVYATAVQDMVNGIQDVTIERGIDPRGFTLAGGGGALGLFAGALARELRVSDVVLPGEAGVVSAVGGLVSDIRRDFTASHVTRSDDFDRAGVNTTLSGLRSDAEGFLERVGVPEADRSVRGFVEARYPGQVWELQIPLPDTEVDADGLERVVERFHREHESVYQYHQPEQPVELLYWRVEAAGETQDPVTRERAGVSERRAVEAVADSQRLARFAGDDVRVPAVRAADIRVGDRFAGPGFVDAANTTIVVPPESVLRVTPAGSYHIDLAAGE